MAWQWLRVQQLSEGDANTTYFHLITRGHRRRNFIPSLTMARHAIADHDGMEQALHEHFVGVFGSPASTGTTLNLQALGIAPIDLTDQEVDFGLEEVWNVIKAMPSDRAPKPDGFTGAF